MAWRYRAASDLRASWTGVIAARADKACRPGWFALFRLAEQTEFGAARATRTLTWAIAGSTENETAEIT